VKSLNRDWPSERSEIEDLTQQIFQATKTAIRIFGSEAGKNIKEGATNACLTARCSKSRLTFPKVRAAAVKDKSALTTAAKELFADNDFTASIESTTKSVENYRARFSKYQKTLQDALGVKLRAIKIATEEK
jgi:hypothetical protein